MRIVAGEWGGRPLVAPRGQSTRPTSDRVREALFSILGDLSGARVLDLFAGTGAVALEALSRGAEHAVLVERARAALAALYANVERLGAAPRVEIVPLEVGRFLESLEPKSPSADELDRSAARVFDLVYADPPWAEAVAVDAVILPRANKLLRSKGTLVVERAARDPLPPEVPGLVGPRPRRYGDALLAFYERAD